MNNRLSLEFGQTYTRIPLETSPHIAHGDALEMDWAEVLPPESCSFVFGNPPFGGSKFQSKAQRAQVRRIAHLGGAGGTLDYVTAWFIKAGEYARGTRIRIGFVATNSITQGEQVAQLWPVLFDRCELEIAFAHRTFAWGSDARGKAHVHVVIIGLDGRESVPARKRLFSYPDINGDPEETRHAVLSPYLFDAGGLADPHLTVREESAPVNGLPRLISGSQPIDNGQYIFSSEEARDEFLSAEPRTPSVPSARVESFLTPACNDCRMRVEVAGDLRAGSRPHQLGGGVRSFAPASVNARESEKTGGKIYSVQSTPGFLVAVSAILPFVLEEGTPARPRQRRNGLRMLLIEEMQSRLGGVSRPTIYRWMRHGQLERPVRLTPNRVAWPGVDE